MSLIQIEIPDEVLEGARQLAVRSHVSLDVLIGSILRDWISMERRIQRLQNSQAPADKERFTEFLRKAPDVEPEPGDRIEGSPSPSGQG